MSHFIFMLTQNDKTVANALDVYRQIRNTAVQYVGFKDIGLPFDELQRLAKEIKADGKVLMLEVVSQTKDDELRSVQAAIKLGVNYLLGGKQAREVAPMLAKTCIRYFPFACKTVGHPTVLEGTEDEIVEDAKMLSSLPGVHGLDLLAYRYSGDAAQLTRKVVAAVKVPVIAAGSIDRLARIQEMQSAGAWAFTVGSALFEGAFAADMQNQHIVPQIEKLLAYQK
jgi:2-keto-3-deoxy-6-phosphogluconate aldolase